MKRAASIRTIKDRLNCFGVGATTKKQPNRQSVAGEVATCPVVNHESNAGV
jgi:hypothetical protein